MRAASASSYLPMRAERGPVRARGGYPGGFKKWTEVGDKDYSLERKNLQTDQNWFFKLLKCWWANRAVLELPTSGYKRTQRQLKMMKTLVLTMMDPLQWKG